MELVLHEGVERFRGLAVFIIVVAALLKHIGNFLVSPALAGPDLPDALQQFIKVIFAKWPTILHQFIVEDKALLDVLFQGLGGPLAEVGGLFGVDPVAYGDDGVEIVMVNAAPHFAAALLANYREFLGSCRLLQFTVRIDVFQVQRDVVSGAVEQFCHAALCQPKGFVLEHHADELLVSTVVVQ